MFSGRYKKLVFTIFAVLFLAGLVYLFFNDSGIVKYLKLKQQVNALNAQVDSANAENSRLQLEIDSLQNKVPAKIEKVAREKYNMIRKGEKAIKIIEK